MPTHPDARAADLPAGGSGRQIPDPGFGSDDGSPDPALRDALARHARGAASAYDVVAALAATRLLVPVVAVLDSVQDEVAEPVAGAAALRREKDSHLATASLLQPDGRRALIAFTGLDAMAAWDAAARPVAASAARAAAAALQDDSDAIVLDLGGPHPFAVPGAAVAALADGRPWYPIHADPQVRRGIEAVVAGLPGVHGVSIERGTGDVELLVTLSHDPAMSPAAVVDVATRAGHDVATLPVVRQRLTGSAAIAVRPA
ncbi:MAG: SseB family protein [Actinomycetota bacterium]|nr:MAG: SseB family protein [Actinomycetota bacterium]